MKKTGEGMVPSRDKQSYLLHHSDEGTNSEEEEEEQSEASSLRVTSTNNKSVRSGRESSLLLPHCRWEDCGQKFASAELARLHEKEYHFLDEDVVECKIGGCGKKFTNHQKLVRHSVAHRERQFLCDNCGKRFFHSWDLKRHMFLHSNERPFLCPVQGCNRSFTKAINCEAHLTSDHHIMEVKRKDMKTISPGRTRRTRRTHRRKRELDDDDDDDDDDSERHLVVESDEDRKPRDRKSTRLATEDDEQESEMPVSSSAAPDHRLISQQPMNVIAPFPSVQQYPPHFSSTGPSVQQAPSVQLFSYPYSTMYANPGFSNGIPISSHPPHILMPMMQPTSDSSYIPAAMNYVPHEIFLQPSYGHSYYPQAVQSTVMPHPQQRQVADVGLMSTPSATAPTVRPNSSYGLLRNNNNNKFSSL